jgi:hypothetical protein
VITPLDLIGFANSTFYGPEWFLLAQVLADLDAQTPTASLRTFRGFAQPELVENSFQPQFCSDWGLPIRNFAEYKAHFAVQNLIAPDMRFSPLGLGATMACLGWPGKVNNPQHPLRVRNAPTLLMLNALHDPATAYVWALNAKAQLGPAARFVTYEGWGHGTYGRSACLTGIVDAYLVSGTLPANGTRCAAVPPQPDTAATQGTTRLPKPANRW